MALPVWTLSGEVGLFGIWHTITTARSFDKLLLNPPRDATHYIRFTGGITANIIKGESVSGTGMTAFVEGISIEDGAFGTSDTAGILWLRKKVGVLTGTTITGALSTGVVTVSQDPIEINFSGPPRSVWIFVEGFSINVTVDGATPTVTAGTNYGVTLPPVSNTEITGFSKIKHFQAINAVNASGAIMKYIMSW